MQIQRKGNLKILQCHGVVNFSAIVWQLARQIVLQLPCSNAKAIIDVKLSSDVEFVLNGWLLFDWKLIFVSSLATVVQILV